MVWLKARRYFTFKGTPYASGHVFAVSALEAVQMRVSRAVDFAKRPANPTPAPKRRGRTYTTKHMVAAPPVVAEPALVQIPVDDDQNSDLHDED